VPEVLFLDEPTTGLDPRSRGELWDFLRELVRDGTTVLLTTQYLDEADRLADDIVVLDHGRVVAKGTPAELKSRIGNDRVDATLANRADAERAARTLEAFTDVAASVDHEAFVVSAPVAGDVRLIEVMRVLDDAGIDVVDLNRRQPTLDDVFLTLTATPATDPTAPEGALV
jgi:ABC-2 type transport system ATP-binding protein